MILDLVIKWAIPTILSGMLGIAVKSINNMLKEIRNFRKDITENDMVIMWSLLQSMTEEVMRKKYCDENTMACVDALYSKYSAMGGNHGMNIRVQKCKLINGKNIR